MGKRLFFTLQIPLIVDLHAFHTRDYNSVNHLHTSGSFHTGGTETDYHRVQCDVLDCCTFGETHTYTKQNETKKNSAQNKVPTSNTIREHEFNYRCAPCTCT